MTMIIAISVTIISDATKAWGIELPPNLLRMTGRRDNGTSRAAAELACPHSWYLKP
jgi:hypothetical protein